MNKKSIAIVCLTACYSVLFYHQHIGINLVIFTLATIGFCFFENKEAFKSKAVLLLSTGAMFSSCFAFIHNSNLSMWTTFVALLLIPGAIINKRSSIVIDLFSSLYTTLVSPGYMIVDIVDASKNEKGKGKSFLRMLKYIVPAVFIIMFFFIYRAMNPLFEKLTHEIAEIISVEWVFFTLGGLFLVYSYYKQQRNKKIDEWEKKWKLQLTKEEQKVPKWSEGAAFVFLFIVLNIMLVAVNSMDVNYLYLGKGMPKGIDHKQFVHKGVGMLILSIILGITILLYFFRGYLNFGKHKNVLKILAFLWVAQNIFMVFSTGIRNTMYVDAALLTYKRIGVYFWLFFALLGLITLFIKLWKDKSVWYLARYNFTILYVVLLASSVLDWDMVISNFNLKRASQMEEISSLDKNYLLSISEGNIAGLFAIKDVEGFEVDSAYSYSGYGTYHVSNTNGLHVKVFKFLEDELDGDWRSYSLRRERVMTDIQNLDAEGELNSLELQSSYVKTIEPLQMLKNVKELNLNDNNFNQNEQLAGINNLPKIEKLYLNNNYISNLDTVDVVEQLVKIELNDNQLNNLKFLEKFPNLDTLEISRNQLISMSSLPQMESLQVLVLDGNPLNNLSRLKVLDNLKSLSINNAVENVGQLPDMKSLEKLSVVNSLAIINHGLDQAPFFENLKYLDLSSGNLQSLQPLLRNDGESTLAPKLNTLIVSYNRLKRLNVIPSFEHLEYLYADNNDIYKLEGVEKLNKLQELYLSNNRIKSIEELKELKNLKKLDLSNNPKIKDFSALLELSNLDYLILRNTHLNNLQIINAEAPLTVLNLSKCRINDWSQLTDFKQLTHLTVSYLTKDDIALFSQLKTLEYLTITDTEEEIIELLKQKLVGVEIY